MSWYPSENLIAQLGHGCAGGLFIAMGRLHRHQGLAFALLVVWVILKEFVFDILIEKDGWANGAKDAASYFAGGIVGYL